MVIPPEIKQEITDLVGLSQWWYLHQTFSHDIIVQSICFDLAGKHLATVSSDDKARVFDIQTNKEIACFQLSGYVRSACFNPEGKLFATVLNGNKACIFDTQTNKEIAYFQPNGYIFSVRFDPEEKILATTSYDGGICIFDVQTNKEFAYFHHNNCFNSACFNVKEKFLATASNDGKARIFNIQTDKEIACFQHNNCVNSICFDTTEKFLATAAKDGKIRIFSRYDSFTIQQLMLKKALHNWLLIEKPNKKIESFEQLIPDVALKCALPYKELMATWFTFSENMQNALWRAMQYKMQKYGKTIS